MGFSKMVDLASHNASSSSHSLSSHSPSTPKSIPSFSFSPLSLRHRLTTPSPSFRINYRTNPLFILHSTDSDVPSFDGGSFDGLGGGDNRKKMTDMEDTVTEKAMTERAED